MVQNSPRVRFACGAKTYGRIISLLENEWGLSEETISELAAAKAEKARLMEKA